MSMPMLLNWILLLAVQIVTKIFIVEIVLQGAFSFDDYFKTLVEGVLPELQQEDDNDHTAHQVGLVGSPLLAGGGIQNLGSIFKQAQFQLVDLCFQVLLPFRFDPNTKVEQPFWAPSLKSQICNIFCFWLCLWLPKNRWMEGWRSCTRRWNFMTGSMKREYL